MERNVIVDDLEFVPTSEICQFCKVDSKVWNAERDGSISIRSKAGDIETSIGLQDQDCVICLEKRHVHVWAGYSSGCIRIFTIDTPSLVTELLRHEGSVLCFAAACSPVEWLFSGGQDGNVLQWNADTFVLVATYTGHRGPVRCLYWCPKALLSGSEDGMIRCWDVDSHTCRHELKGHKAAVLALCPSYGDTLWSGSEDCTVRVWDILTCRPITALSQHRGAVTCLANVGDFVLSGSLDNTICMWDSRSHQCIHSLASHQGHIHWVGWVAAAVKYTFWSTSSDHTIRRWTFEVTGSSMEREASARLGLSHLDREVDLRRIGDTAITGVPQSVIDALEREHQEACKKYQAEIRELQAQKTAFDTKLQQTTALFDAIQNHSEGLKMDYEAEIQQFRIQLSQKDAELRERAAELKEKVAEVKAKAVEVKEKEVELQRRDAELRRVEGELQRLEGKLQGVEEGEVRRLEVVEAELRHLKKELHHREEELKGKDLELDRLQREQEMQPSKDDLGEMARRIQELQDRDDHLTTTVKALKAENEKLRQLQTGLNQFTSDAHIGRDESEIYHILNTRTGLVNHLGELQSLANTSRRRVVQCFDLPALRLAPQHVKEAVLQQLNVVAVSFDDVVDKCRLLVQQYLTKAERSAITAKGVNGPSIRQPSPSLDAASGHNPGRKKTNVPGYARPIRAQPNRGRSASAGIRARSRSPQTMAGFPSNTRTIMHGSISTGFANAQRAAGRSRSGSRPNGDVRDVGRPRSRSGSPAVGSGNARARSTSRSRAPQLPPDAGRHGGKRKGRGAKSPSFPDDHHTGADQPDTQDQSAEGALSQPMGTSMTPDSPRNPLLDRTPIVSRAAPPPPHSDTSSQDSSSPSNSVQRSARSPAFPSAPIPPVPPERVISPSDTPSSYIRGFTVPANPILGGGTPMSPLNATIGGSNPLGRATRTADNPPEEDLYASPQRTPIQPPCTPASMAQVGHDLPRPVSTCSERSATPDSPSERLKRLKASQERSRSQEALAAIETAEVPLPAKVDSNLSVLERVKAEHSHIMARLEKIESPTHLGRKVSTPGRKDEDEMEVSTDSAFSSSSSSS